MLRGAASAGSTTARAVSNVGFASMGSGLRCNQRPTQAMFRTAHYGTTYYGATEAR